MTVGHDADTLKAEAATLFAFIHDAPDVAEVRRRLFARVSAVQYGGASEGALGGRVKLRDCSRAWRGLLTERSDTLAGFSVAQALWDLARGVPRPDLQAGFFAELIHLVRGLDGRAEDRVPTEVSVDAALQGRDAAQARSGELDRIWAGVSRWMARYEDGLSDAAQARRAARRARILAALGGGEDDWADWHWQVRHVVKDAETLARLVPLTEGELAAVRAARAGRVPFGVTPYYVSLMDEDPEAGRDRAVRAQVLPPADYVRELAAHHGERDRAFDFMLERDTSPIDLITRRYPSVVILKPYNTCPQICVYCQRNWEIDDCMAPGALASAEAIEAACAWIEAHPAVTEVLVTGGDPLVLGDDRLAQILERVARIDSIEVIRVGTRVPVTVPMRVTDALADVLGDFRMPGRREIAVMTHVEHVYEITPELVAAVDRLRRRGVAVYNQHVYTFWVSRRYENARLRMLLRRAGIDPYYTFAPKGKEETRSYRVPLARLLQERREEARVLPGLRRADETVYNVPGLGKNYLRAYQQRDLLSILPDGARVYQFHPWEKELGGRDAYVGTDVPVLEYLTRLAEIGEDPAEYESIWYYY